VKAVTEVQAEIMLEDPSLDASEAFELARMAVSSASEAPRWEYKRLEYEPDDVQLTMLGAEGWELCSFQQLHGYQMFRKWVWVFKRPIRVVESTNGRSAESTHPNPTRSPLGTASVAPEGHFTITQPWSTPSS
jgi:hypothetical protein